jgi:hypothetical protein
MSVEEYERISRPACLTAREGLPDGVEAAFQRARLDALRRRDLA